MACFGFRFLNLEGVAGWLETHKTLPIVDATIVSITSSRYELQSSRKLAASTTNLQVDLGGKNQFTTVGKQKTV